MTTTNEGTQRDELAQDIAASLGGGNASVRAITNVAEALITKGYRKPRTITTVAEMNALPFQSVITDAYGTPYVCEKHRVNGTANEWCASGTNYLQASQYVLEHGDATVWYEPEAEATR